MNPSIVPQKIHKKKHERTNERKCVFSGLQNHHHHQLGVKNPWQRLRFFQRISYWDIYWWIIHGIIHGIIIGVWDNPMISFYPNLAEIQCSGC